MGWTDPLFNACISGENTKVILKDMTLAECRRRCEEERLSFKCRSIEWWKGERYNLQVKNRRMDAGEHWREDRTNHVYTERT